MVDTDSDVFAFATSLRSVLERTRALSNEIEMTLVVLTAHERALKKMKKDDPE